MNLVFDVGNAEQHHVEFNFNRFWGGLSIKVDGVTVVRQFRMYSFHLEKSYQFLVGDQEKHAVRIVKYRDGYYAGFRPQQVRAYVDGQLVAEGIG
jgi:hypothetical protein